MEFGLTIPLQKFLKLKVLEYGDSPNLFFCWDVHRADIRGTKLLVVVNASNRFAAVSRMTGAGWKRWDSYAAEAIRAALTCSEVAP